MLAIGDRHVTVAVDAPPACARCAAGRGCGAGLLTRRRGPSAIEVRVVPGLVLAPGDRVRLDVAPERLLAAAGFVYGLPLAGLVAGALGAGALVPGEPAAVAGALAGLIAGALLGRRGLSRRAHLERCVPVAAARIG